MKKNLKVYFLTTIIGSIILFTLIMGIKYIIDPVGLNNKFDLGLFKDVNLSLRTQKFVELNKVKPNTLIIGGSRVHYMQVEDLQKYTNDIVYNLGLPYSTLEEQYYFLKYALENFDIKNVIIGANFYSFSNKLFKTNSDFDKDILENGFGFVKQFQHYLKSPTINYLKYVYNNKGLTEPFYKNGAITQFQEDFTLRTEEEKRINRSYLGYKNSYKNYMDFDLDKPNKNLEYFKKSIELCKKHNINYIVLTTSVHIKQLNSIKEVDMVKDYYLWKEELARITPYWDFMYNHSISNDSEYFIDTSHLKSKYVAYYLVRLFNDKNENVPNDFGIYVDKNNIKEHIENLKKINGF